MVKGRKIPEVLTKEEQKALLNQPNIRYPTGQRNYTMLKLMLNIGLRLSEIINLTWDDINLMSGKVMVRHGKGAKDRILWTSNEVINLLIGWKEKQFNRLGKSVKPVFSTLSKNSNTIGKKLLQRYIQEMVSRYARKAKIKKNITPHTLRHSFATDLYKETKDIRLVQKALGHADISTTMIYTHIVDEDLEKALKSFK
jgi:integrase/recombinase XerD